MIDNCGGDDGVQFNVASECNVLEARKEAIQTRMTYDIVAAAVHHCSWRYLTSIDIFGGDNGARFTVASECDVLEARKEAIQTRKTRV